MMVQSTDFTNFDDLTFSGRLGSSELRSVFAERQMSAPTVCDTTHQFKTHNAEAREVQYPWPPWFGRTVWLYRIAVGPTKSVARCGLERTQCARAVDVPLWMFEAAACSALRVAEEPAVDCAALQTLIALLHGAVLQNRHSSQEVPMQARTNRAQRAQLELFRPQS
jgi:hypothetical protein